MASSTSRMHTCSTVVFTGAEYSKYTRALTFENVWQASVHVRAEFTLLVFRPFNSEVIVGTVRKSTREDGIWISIGFFEDILVPPQFMPEGSEFDESLQLWVWKSEYGNAEISSQSPVRFRVNNVVFRQVTRPQHAPPVVTGDALRANSDEDAEEDKEKAQDKALLVMASIKDDGLGMVIWHLISKVLCTMTFV